MDKLKVLDRGRKISVQMEGTSTADLNVLSRHGVDLVKTNRLFILLKEFSLDEMQLCSPPPSNYVQVKILFFFFFYTFYASDLVFFAN